MEQVKSVLKHLADALAVLQDLIEQTRIDKKRAIERQNQAQESLVAIEAREKVVLEKERLIQTAEELEKRENDLAYGVSNLETKVKVFERKQSDRLALLDEKEDDYKNRNEDLKQRIAALEKEKKGYKNKLLASLGKE